METPDTDVSTPIAWRGLKVLITGGGSGIGAALAQALSQHGARIAVVDINKERAEHVEQAIVTAGGAASAFVCDVGERIEVERLRDQITAEFGGLNALFNNAGVGADGALSCLSQGSLDWTVSVNFVAPMLMARTFLGMLKVAAAKGEPAWIVNTGSEHSLAVPPSGALNAYTACKHALLGLSDVLRHDLHGTGVRVALLCPSLTATNAYLAANQRPTRFGEPEQMSATELAQTRSEMAAGQNPNETARICLRELDRGAFLILTNASAGGFIRERLAEIEAAIVRIEEASGTKEG